MNRTVSNVTNVEDLEDLINRIKNNLDEILPKPSVPAENSPSRIFMEKLRELHDDVDSLKEIIETRVSFNAGPATPAPSIQESANLVPSKLNNRKRKTRKTRR